MPHIGRNKIVAFLKQQGARLGTNHCKATSKFESCIFNMRYHRASLEPLSAQLATAESSYVAPTLSEWFDANIEVTGNKDDAFPRSAAVHGAMAQVSNVDEPTVTRFSKSKGLELELLPRSTRDGKDTHTHTHTHGLLVVRVERTMNLMQS